MKRRGFIAGAAAGLATGAVGNAQIVEVQLECILSGKLGYLPPDMVEGQTLNWV